MLRGVGSGGFDTPHAVFGIATASVHLRPEEKQAAVGREPELRVEGAQRPTRVGVDDEHFPPGGAGERPVRDGMPLSGRGTVLRRSERAWHLRRCGRQEARRHEE